MRRHCTVTLFAWRGQRMRDDMLNLGRMLSGAVNQHATVLPAEARWQSGLPDRSGPAANDDGAAQTMRQVGESDVGEPRTDALRGQYDFAASAAPGCRESRASGSYSTFALVTARRAAE